MYKCPLCGASSNRKEEPFEHPSAVVGHIDAKRDQVHAGEDGEDYREAIEPIESDSEGSESGPRGGDQTSNVEDDVSPSGGQGSRERMPETGSQGVSEPSSTTEDTPNSGGRSDPVFVESQVEDVDEEDPTPVPARQSSGSILGGVLKAGMTLGVLFLGLAIAKAKGDQGGDGLELGTQAKPGAIEPTERDIRSRYP